MTIVTLYNKGYYIHKRLLVKSFNNEVLREVRKLSQGVEVVSIETRSDGDEDMEKLTLGDTIRDWESEYDTRDKENDEISKMIFKEVKEILIETMGKRQFEQLLNDYANGHTTTWSRRKMQTVKSLFEKEQLTRQKFNNKYGR